MKTLDMPSFGADMETGKVVEWCAKAGDTLKKGETVALIETAKGLIDMEVFENCTIQEFIAPLDEEIHVGLPIVRLISEATDEDESETDKLDAVKLEVVKNIEKPPVEMHQAINVEPGLSPSATITWQSLMASPAAKALALQHNIDISLLTGTGAEGAICLADVEKVKAGSNDLSSGSLTRATVASSKKSPARKGTFDAEQMRLAIANVVSKSKREIPHYYLSLDIDLSPAEHWLEQINEERLPEDRLMINVPLMCAVARALHKHPDFNGFYQDNHFESAAEVNLGLAIRLRNKGLVSPAIHNADRLDAIEMMRKLKDVVERAKLGGLKQSELQDATTTLSNIGDRGSDQIFGVIFPPQVALIGIGKIGQKALVVDQEIKIRTVVNISLAADHRVTDGVMGARFLNEINKLLQKPAQFIGGMS